MISPFDIDMAVNESNAARPGLGFQRNLYALAHHQPNWYETITRPLGCARGENPLEDSRVVVISGAQTGIISPISCCAGLWPSRWSRCSVW
jgi:hypothetical protein